MRVTDLPGLLAFAYPLQKRHTLLPYFKAKTEKKPYILKHYFYRFTVCPPLQFTPPPPSKSKHIDIHS